MNIVRIIVTTHTHTHVYVHTYLQTYTHTRTQIDVQFEIVETAARLKERPATISILPQNPDVTQINGGDCTQFSRRFHKLRDDGDLIAAGWFIYF